MDELPELTAAELAERNRRFPELDYERRSRCPTFATVITQGCVCAWDVDDEVAGAKLWRMTTRNRICPWHGVAGVF